MKLVKTLVIASILLGLGAILPATHLHSRHSQIAAVKSNCCDWPPPPCPPDCPPPPPGRH